MASNASQLNLKIVESDKEPKNAIEKIKSTHTQELVFVLSGYMGSNIHSVADNLKLILENDYDYKCEIIKLSSFIDKNKLITEIPFEKNASKPYKRIKTLILNGNALRDKFGLSILAELSILKIGYERIEEQSKATGTDQDNDQKKFESRRNCYIIDSIKNPKELDLLREVYRNLIYFIGVFSPYKIRETNLSQDGISKVEILDLINQDSHEEMPNGQDVRDTFMQADYFLRIDSISKLKIKEKLERFVHLIFGSEIITPTKDETAMFFASSASTNSACLSRQVGAAITDKKGDVISIGWNDVPCYQGNLYKHSNKELKDENDNRCLNFHNGICSNDYNKAKIQQELIEQFRDKKILNISNEDTIQEILENSSIKGLTEFTRAVHAEMHALIIGSQKSGDKMINGKLYCTTFPCHNCAKHIILAGITEIYYIEPYSKSLAGILHSDSITEDENENNKVHLFLYDGVSPTRYTQLFKMKPGSRKDKEGYKIKVDCKKISPKYTETLEALYSLESFSTRDIMKEIRENNLNS